MICVCVCVLHDDFHLHRSVCFRGASQYGWHRGTAGRGSVRAVSLAPLENPAGLWHHWRTQGQNAVDRCVPSQDQRGRWNLRWIRPGFAQVFQPWPAPERGRCAQGNVVGREREREVEGEHFQQQFMKMCLGRVRDLQSSRTLHYQKTLRA